MLTLTPERILVVVLFFFVPGLVANRVYALKCPGPKPDWDKMLLEIGTYSIFNLLFWSWLVWPYFTQPLDQWTPWKFSINGLLVGFVSPTTIALLWRWLRVNYLHHQFGVDHPTARGWDYFLTHRDNRGKEFFVLFHLKCRKDIGGYFGGNSLASTYPQEPEIYVEQLWRVDEDGKFLEAVDGSSGSVIRQSEWDWIEFFEVKHEVENGSEKQGVCGTVESSSADEGPTADGRIGGALATGSNGEAGRQDHPATRWIGECPPADPYTTKEVRNTDG